MSKWIKCSDRMPELNIEVLGFTGKKFGSYVLAELITDSLGEMSWHIFGVNEYDAGFGSINYWMPLPESPNE